MLFSGLSLRIPKGAFIRIEGPSGAGKSTLLRLFVRLEEPTQGSLAFEGRPFAAIPPPQLRAKVGYLQQTPAVLDASVRDNLLLPFTFKANTHLTRPTDSALRDALDTLLLQGVSLDDNGLTLSVGQKQRLCLARTLFLPLTVLLLDEPVSALDPDSRRVVEEQTLRAHKERGITVVLVSHTDAPLLPAEHHVVHLGKTPSVPEELK